MSKQAPALLVFIVAYNAEKHIEGVFDRIPDSVWNSEIARSDVLVIDDASQDQTYDVCMRYRERTGRQMEIRKNAINQGYGGNQKLGYMYAIEKGYNLVVLLHGDGQYDPTLIPLLAAPVLSGQADVVIGSRMMNKRSALKGGMPLYKFIGNIVLTKIQNWILGVRLSEFHSGYRVYSVASLKKIPFQHNSNYFDFDTDILIQLIQTKQRFHEISIPTFYGDEISHVNGIKYAVRILYSSMVAKLQLAKITYSKKYDYNNPNN